MTTQLGSAAVDAAIVDRLQKDATLMTLCPDGVWFARAGQGAQAFVIVDLLGHVTEYEFTDEAFETTTYRVHAVGLAATALVVATAANRIHQLLQFSEASAPPFTADGFVTMRVQRVEYLRWTEDDPENTSVRWQHVGGRYQFVMAPRPEGTTL